LSSVIKPIIEKEQDTMADDLGTALNELLRMAEVEQDTDFLREGVRILSQPLKAERYEHTAERTGQRNGLPLAPVGYAGRQGRVAVDAL
jgi:hypothetical protein